MRALVIYYSRTGHVKKIAEKIANDLNAKTIEVEPTVPYKGYVSSVVRVFKESKTGKKIKSKTKPIDVKTYNPIVIVFPVWYSNVPQVLLDYIHKLKIENKKIIAFSRSNGSSGDKAVDTLKKKLPSCLFILPFHQKRNNDSEYTEWMNKIKQIFAKDK